MGSLHYEQGYSRSGRVTKSDNVSHIKYMIAKMQRNGQQWSNIFYILGQFRLILFSWPYSIIPTILAKIIYTH